MKILICANKETSKDLKLLFLLKWLNSKDVSIIFVNQSIPFSYYVSICDLFILWNQKDLNQIIFLKFFHMQKKSVLAIEEGMLLLNLFFNGINKKNDFSSNKNHSIYFYKNSLLTNIYPSIYYTISNQNTSIYKPGKNIKIEAISKEGNIEVISYSNNIVGINWMPTYKDPILSFFS